MWDRGFCRRFARDPHKVLHPWSKIPECATSPRKIVQCWPSVKSGAWQTLEEDSFGDVRFLNEEVQEEQMATPDEVLPSNWR